MTEGKPSFDEIPELQIGALLRKLDWALRQEPAGRRGKLAFYRVDRRFIEAAGDFLREVAGRHPESYREFAHRAQG